MNDFLPPNYSDEIEIKKENGYFKMKEDAAYRIRFLSSPVTGIEAWKDGKPLRFRSKKDVPNEDWDINKFNGLPKKPCNFWASIIWDYTDEKMKIFSFTQPSIMNSIIGLVDDPEWGSPKDYDLKIIRGKKDGKVTYEVRACKPTELDPMIIAEYGLCDWNLDKLFDGGDPFTK